MTQINVYRDLEVEALIELYDGLLTPSNYSLPIRDHLMGLSERLLYRHSSKHEGIKFPTAILFGKKSMEEIFASDFTLDDAKDCVAKDFRYENWEEVEALGLLKPDSKFELLVDRLLSGDIERLKSAMKEDPDLVHQKSCYAHESTLLHYTGSNGVEPYRQVVPKKLPAISELLLSSGADTS